MAIAEKCISRANQVGAIVGNGPGIGVTGKPHSNGLLILVTHEKKTVITIDIDVDGNLVSSILNNEDFLETYGKLKEMFAAECPDHQRVVESDSTVIADSKNVSIEAFEHYLELLESDDEPTAKIMRRVREHLQKEIPEMQQEIVHMMGNGKSLEYHNMLRKLTYAVSTVTSALVLRYLIDIINEITQEIKTDEQQREQSSVADSGTSGEDVPTTGSVPAGDDNQSEEAGGIVDSDSTTAEAV